MKVAVLTLFPEMFSAITQSGITRRAVEKGLIEIELFNPRDFTEDKHRTVDDRPYGGGPGMVMLAAPLKRALSAACSWHGLARKEIKVIYLSPQGEVLSRNSVQATVEIENLVLIAGRYEGIDQRFIDNEVDQEISIGDYVLSGGELPAMVLLDAMIRRLPGALGDDQSAEQDSFESGALDCPHYTRPENLEGDVAPEVLLSGDHKKIQRWRVQQSLARTYERRKDLFEKLDLTEEEQKLFDEYLLTKRQH